MSEMNNEGRFTLDLPSGRKAVLRPYDAYTADAIGDEALQEEGTNLDKAIIGLVESIDGEKFPSFEDDRVPAIRAARDLLLNDYHHILFMSVASFRDGVFDGEVTDPNGEKIRANYELLKEDGSPIERFDPPKYPEGNERTYEWEEEVLINGAPKLNKFKLKLLDGHARANMVDKDTGNLNAELIYRNPAYWDDKLNDWRMYQPKAHPPAWASKALSRKAKEVDPLIQYSGIFKAKKGGRKFQRTFLGIPDFFLQDFT